MAYVALFFALASTSWAASTALLPPNSVGTRAVVNRSLLRADVKGGQAPRGRQGQIGVSGLAGATGAPGAAGAAGAPGAVGAVGSAGIGGVEVVQLAFSSGYGDATCPAGKKVIGGGAHILSIAGGTWPELTQNHPLPDGSGWRGGYSFGSPLGSAVVYATCAFVTT